MLTLRAQFLHVPEWLQMDLLFQVFMFQAFLLYL